MKAIRCGEGDGTTPAAAHRQTAYRLLPKKRGVAASGGNA